MSAEPDKKLADRFKCYLRTVSAVPREAPKVDEDDRDVPRKSPERDEGDDVDDLDE